MTNAEISVQPAAFSVQDAGKYLGVSSDTVRRLIRSGSLPHARIGNSIRVRRSDLDEYLDNRTSRQWQRVDGRGRTSSALSILAD